jgi:hypothetical protein
MPEITPEQNNKLVDNLIKSFELTCLCIELRKSYLKTIYNDLSDTELEKMVFAESIKLKQNIWKHGKI